MNNLPLRGQHAIVTGAGRGIGAAIAGALADAGVNLSLIGRDAERLREQAARFEDKVAVHFYSGDLADADSARALFDAALGTGGPAEILVNNAGAVTSTPFVRTDLALWRNMLDINLTAAYIGCQSVLPGMLNVGRGRIVNIASTAALVGYPYVVAYTAAKHGLLGLTRALALEVALRGVTVNAVCPGFTDTDIVQDALTHIVNKTGRSVEQAQADLTRYNPQGRLVDPQEVANAVLWLCLAGSSAVTGQAIAVAGGEVQCG